MPRSKAGKSEAVMPFRDQRIEALEPEPGKQLVYWAAGTPGLSVVVSPAGTRSYRSRFKLHGTWQRRALGRHGDYVDGERGPRLIDCEWARNEAHLDKLDAAKGIDPRDRNRAARAASKATAMTYADAVAEFIDKESKHRHRDWREVQAVLTRHTGALSKRPIVSITRKDIQGVLDDLIAAGKTRTAKVTLSWLNRLWKFCLRRELVKHLVTAECEVIHVPQERRVYTDKELALVWKAADKLRPMERDYVQLALLLAPRRSELACMQRSHLNDDVSIWVVPFELTKSRKTAKRRVYTIPLPPLARAIVLRRLKAADIPLNGEGRELEDDYLFPGARSGKPFDAGKLKDRLVAVGAPKDFILHGIRHTLSTWLQTQGYSTFEGGLVLNHAESGITATYRHGASTALKQKLLTAWAKHVEGLVTPRAPATRARQVVRPTIAADPQPAPAKAGQPA